MKIALFTETYLPHINGVVTHVKSLKEGLEKLGHKVLIVTADASVRHHYVKDGVLRCPGVTSKKYYGFSVAPPLSRSRLKIIRDFNPDIIHIHNEFGIGMFGVHAAKQLGKPLVYTMHTMYDEYLYYVAPKPLINSVKRLTHKYSRYLAKRSAALTGPSAKVSEYFKQIGVEKAVNVIPNPVEIDIFRPENITEEGKRAFREKYQISDDKMIACFCGRLGKEKSVDVLLDYWARTVKPEDNMHLVIIGDGPERPELEEMAEDLGIEEMVTFTGKVMHDEIPPYYASCDIYVTASLSDTNSISMLEGMATGLPVLHRLDPLNEGQVRSGVNGYLYDSPEEMYSELKRLQNMNPEERRILRESVIQSVKHSGAIDLANYVLEVYRMHLDGTHLEEPEE